MISPRDITVVMQGDLRPSTGRAIHSVRQFLPGARLILSTFDREAPQRYAEFVDEVVLSKDPGSLPPSVKANHAQTNNTNRQLVSSQAGLVRVTTPYALKMRTDCILHGIGFIRLFQHYAQTDNQCPRLVVSSFYTRHPRGLACYLFHVSDWFAFGATKRVQQFFSAPLVTLDEATWFERHSHLSSSSYAARRFRARFTPEQHITIHFARTLGYRTPEFLNDYSAVLVEQYERFLANEMIVSYPSKIGFTLEKYSKIECSLYQRIDCISYSDWLDIVHEKNNIIGTGVKSKSACLTFPMRITRKIAHSFRRSIIYITLNIKSFMNSRHHNMSRRPKLACLLTGVPTRGSEVCYETLRFITSKYETTFIAVYREEFDCAPVREALIRNLPGIRFLIVPKSATAEAVKHNSSRFSINLVQQWHEIYYAAESVDLKKFDMVLRTRFDLFYAPMYLPPPIVDDSCILIPERLCWSGSNDMISFSTPSAFKKYSRIYEVLTWANAKGVVVPEVMVSCAVRHLGLEQEILKLYFGLYRQEVMTTFNRSQLGVLAWKSPDYTGYEPSTDTAEGRAAWVKNVEALTNEEALFPTYCEPEIGVNFYPVELDTRDGTPFRFMALHARINRAVSMVRMIEFTICHYPPDFELGKLTVHIDGNLFSLRKKGMDEFGRLRVIGELRHPYHGRTPWSHVGFSYLGARVFAEIIKGSTEHRSLSISITDPLFY
jgi:hypothetical protein